MNSHEDASTTTQPKLKVNTPQSDRSSPTTAVKTPSVLAAERSAHESVARSDARAERRWKLIETIILWTAWIIMVAFNGYAEVFQFQGTTTGQIAKSANVWFMPAGYAFAIWGLIYIGLAVWLVRYCMAGPSRKKLGFLPMSLSGLIFVATCALNICWLAFWHMKRFTISLIIILALTVLTWLLYAIVRHDEDEKNTSSAVRILDWAPLSLYGGWLTVATVLNAFFDAEVLSMGIADVIQVFAVVILLGLLLIVAFLMEQKANDWVFGLVIFWSALAIGIQILSRNTAIGVLVIAIAAVGDVLVYFPWDKFKLVRR
ncbi:hypothetical protein KIMH_08240 [Bombiscardovia apis]|uniref:Tryptophan-rich sensory protein n=1 Tax=Bombiscardovia apis TaxID=2932182 RepID=A0ABM8BCR4_9BIFI|nr:TspO/MBR family protein [Bombiscardovia apis]BDR54713.1 hypothetical protein KIMH_08240 [Bombiscardovia apis]